MKTTNDIIKAINHRVKQLEVFNQQLVELQNAKQDDADLMHIYFENEARLNELTSLLEYIKRDSITTNY